MLGCRWWTATESTIPSLSTISVPATDVRQLPPKMEYRDLVYREQWGVNLWAIRNKIANFCGGGSVPAQYGGTGVMYHGNLVHSWGTLLKAQLADGSALPGGVNIDYDNHSEYWAVTTSGTVNKAQPNTSNPDVRNAIIENAIAWLRAYPNDAFVTVGQNDYDYSHDPVSQAVADTEGAEALVLDLANAVADRVKVEFPDRRVFVMAPAYSWGQRLPKTIRPRDNVSIALCTISNDFGHPVATSTQADNVAFRTVMEEWKAVTTQIYVWDYLTIFTSYMMPNPNLDVLVPNIKYFVDNNVTGYFGQGSHTISHGEFTNLRMWVLAKGMWNPEANNQALITEFLNGYYGAAGPSIQKYIDAIHKPVREDPNMFVDTGWYDGSGWSKHAPWLTASALAEAEAALREAESKVAGDATLEKRVHHAHIPLWYVLAVRGPSSASWRAINRNVGAITPAELATKLAAAIDESGVGPTLDEPWLHPMDKFKAWMADWGARSGTNADMLPPELSISLASDYRLIHAYQMFSQSGNWNVVPFQDTDASDGWVMKSENTSWFIQYPLVSGDDFTPGREYTLFVRVKCSSPTIEGKAFTFGIYGSPTAYKSKSVLTQDLTPGQYQVFQLDPMTLPADPVTPRTGTFWMALSANNGTYAVSEARLDSIWLKSNVSNITYGDVNQDSTVSISDAIVIARSLIGSVTLSADQAQAADVSGDGSVTITDAILIAKKLVGLIDKFPVEE